MAAAEPRRGKRFATRPRPGKASFPQYEHDEFTAPLTITRQSNIRMPDLHLYGGFGALFVLEDDIRAAMINEVLEKCKEENLDYHIWLADDTLHQLPSDGERTTKAPVPSTWHSPFIGKAIEEVFEFVSRIPQDRNLIKGYVAVLNKRLYEEEDWLVLYKIDDEGMITSIPCGTAMSLGQMGSFAQDDWPMLLRQWQWKGEPVMSS